MKQITSDLRTVYLALMNRLPAGLTFEEIKYQTALRTTTIQEALNLLIVTGAITSDITVTPTVYHISNDFLKEYLKSIE